MRRVNRPPQPRLGCQFAQDVLHGRLGWPIISGILGRRLLPTSRSHSGATSVVTWRSAQGAPAASGQFSLCDAALALFGRTGYESGLHRLLCFSGTSDIGEFFRPLLERSVIRFSSGALWMIHIGAVIGAVRFTSAFSASIRGMGAIPGDAADLRKSFRHLDWRMAQQ